MYILSRQILSRELLEQTYEQNGPSSYLQNILPKHKAPHRTFSKVDHILGLNGNLNKYKKIKHFWAFLFDKLLVTISILLIYLSDPDFTLVSGIYQVKINFKIAMFSWWIFSLIRTFSILF